MHFCCFHFLNVLSWKLESQEKKKKKKGKLQTDPKDPETGNGAILATGGNK